MKYIILLLGVRIIMSDRQRLYNLRYKAKREAQEYLPYDPVTLERVLPTMEDLGIYSHKDFRYKYFSEEFSLEAPHQNVWDTLIDRFQQIIILSPRGVGKSIFFSKSFPLYFMLRNYNSATLLVTETDDLAKGYTTSIVEALMKNPKLVEDFNTPALLDPMKGRQGYSRHEIHFKRSVSRKEDTFKAVGLGKKIIGIHPDLIILDDIIQEGKTQLKQEQIERWIDKVILPMRKPNTKIVMIGTRKDPDDIYNYMMRKGTFEVSVQKIISEIPDYIVKRNESGRILSIEFTNPYWDVYENARRAVLWPQRYTLKEVCLIREEMGHIAFSGEMMNSPVVEEGIQFQRDWLRFYNLGSVLENNLSEFLRWRIFMAVDIGGAQRTSDFSCVASVGFFGNKIYILRLNYGHWKIPTLLQQIYKDYKYWEEYGNKPMKVGVEENFMQKAVIEYLDEFTWLPLKGIRQSRRKETRIDPLSAYFERGRIFIDPDIRGYNEFLVEYLNYPNGKHDDLLDALEMAISLGTSSKPSHYGVYR